MPALPLPAFDCPAYRVAPIEEQSTCPLPEDPVLAAMVTALNGELGYAISPAVAKEILGAAYRAFPDSAAARGKVDESESASALQRAVAQLLRGAYW